MMAPFPNRASREYNFSGNMQIRQLLLAIGGSATRLKSGGYAVPVSKSFIHFKGRPLLYWSLLSAHHAGIRDVVLAGDSVLPLEEASLVLQELPVRFDRVELFQDPGLGVHGLPFQALHLLDEEFIFDCGHSVTPSAHTRRLAEAKKDGEIVFTAFDPHPLNLRQPVCLRDGRVIPAALGQKQYAVAHPLALDRTYARLLPERSFAIANILDFYISRRAIRYVSAKFPPEFDIAAELRGARRPLAREVKRLLQAAS